ncbi:hypothetical protein [Bacillus solitudinis]|uniref:hypothetical protein n=1 Tax=Bacillus solitudinis TaxID=2014074 RepID=UPI000C250F48|nr:hypothetical protein [Bacillus solitudinis]
MARQITLVSFAVLMFITVWVVVILKLGQSHSQPEFATGSITNDDIQVMESERAVPFPESIKDEQYKIDEVTQIANEQIKEEAATILEEFLPQISSKVDLRNYDFSDISTADGVPIDGILEKIKIE